MDINTHENSCAKSCKGLKNPIHALNHLPSVSTTNEHVGQVNWTLQQTEKYSVRARRFKESVLLNFKDVSNLEHRVLFKHLETDGML